MLALPPGTNITDTRQFLTFLSLLRFLLESGAAQADESSSLLSICRDLEAHRVDDALRLVHEGQHRWACVSWHA